MRQRHLGVTATPLSSGTPGKALLVLHDITGLRRVEKTRKEFVANVSHELRTPLTSIKAAVDTLQEGAMGDPQAAAAFLTRINSEVDRMAALISDLLELSRLESGQVLPNMAPTALASLVEEVVERLADKARAKYLAVKLDIPSDLPQVIADCDMVSQVVYNLLDNAIRFTPSGGQVSVTASRRDGAIAVAIEDTGIGIASEHLPRVFERFYKVDKSRSGGGTGLGLAIARHIVRTHGGEIWVESEEGRGSTFIFTIPLAP